MGAGGQLAFEFGGPTLAASLDRAVECFAECVADVHPSLATARAAVEVTGATPSALLLAVLEECLRRGREGEVVLALERTEVHGGLLRADVVTVPADDPHVDAALPHVVSWHEVCLEPDGEGTGWHGRVVAR